MKNIKAKYVLANVDSKVCYLLHDYEITENWKEALTFDSKEEAVSFLDKNYDKFPETINFAWTTREFFVKG